MKFSINSKSVTKFVLSTLKSFVKKSSSFNTFSYAKLIANKDLNKVQLICVDLEVVDDEQFCTLEIDNVSVTEGGFCFVNMTSFVEAIKESDNIDFEKSDTMIIINNVHIGINNRNTFFEDCVECFDYYDSNYINKTQTIQYSVSATKEQVANTINLLDKDIFKDSAFFIINKRFSLLTSTDAVRFNKHIFNRQNDNESINKEYSLSHFLVSKLKNLKNVTIQKIDNETYPLSFEYIDTNITYHVYGKVQNSHYKNYDNYVPEHFNYSFIMEKSSLQNLVKQFSKAKSLFLNLSFTNNKLEISLSKNDSTTIEQKLSMPVITNSKDSLSEFSIVFDKRYLLDAIKSVSEKYVRVLILRDDTPAVFCNRSAYSDPFEFNTESNFHLLMPIYK